MDELKPTSHKRPRLPRSLRSRRLRLAGGLVGLIIILATALAQAAPQTISQVIPEPIRQVINDTQEAAGDMGQTIVDAQPGLWHVEHVVDGDTLNVTMDGKKETVRMLGLDTPEVHDPRKPVQCFGEAASAHTKQLLEGKNVRLEPDPTNSDRDKYRRLLRYVYLPDGTLINAALIRDGYAFAYTVFPLTKLEDFRALEREAREANRGLWAGCNVDDSKQIKQTTGAKT